MTLDNREGHPNTGRPRCNRRYPVAAPQIVRKERVIARCRKKADAGGLCKECRKEMEARR